MSEYPGCGEEHNDEELIISFAEVTTAYCAMMGAVVSVLHDMKERAVTDKEIGVVGRLMELSDQCADAMMEILPDLQKQMQYVMEGWDND